MHFVCFAHTEGKMYTYSKMKGKTFVIKNTKKWGNSVVYGAVFLCERYYLYQEMLDAFHRCSMSNLGKNHHLDMTHRLDIEVTPITFATLDDMARLLYKEKDPITVQAYLANTKHPKINQRIYDKWHNYRVIDGLDARYFKEMYKGVC